MAAIDIYTDRNEPAGYSADKRDAHARGLWHRVFTCLVINTDTQTAYLQKKTPHRYVFDRPDHLDITVGGHYEAGESIADGVRELAEETGLRVPFSQLVSLGQRQTSVVLAPEYHNNEFQHVFLLPTQAGLTDLRPDGDEVHGFVAVPLEAGLGLMQGKTPALTVQGNFMTADGPALSSLAITRDDFVPAYLATDCFMPRLFIAAQRYLRGDDLSALYW